LIATARNPSLGIAAAQRLGPTRGGRRWMTIIGGTATTAALHGTADEAMPGMKSIGLVTTTATEGTRGTRLRQGLGPGNATRSVLGTTTLTATERSTETDETTEAETETETDPERATTEIMAVPRLGMTGQTNTPAQRLLINDTPRTLKYNLLPAQEQTATKNLTRTPNTTQASQIVKSLSGV
jgi:hypothetical protein